VARSATRGDQIHARLRADILAGRRPPGSRLPFAELTSDYDASIGVLREALARLTAEGLVVAEPQQGYRVISLSIKDLGDLTAARCEVEGSVLRSSIEHGDLEWESRIVAAVHRLERTPDRDAGDPSVLSDTWAVAHTDFHLSLVAGCPNSRLLAIVDGLWASLEIYVRWSAPVKPPERDVRVEHRALADAALARDADAAVEALELHVTATQQVLLDGLGQLLGPPTTTA
jgi:DNA-binding GntR family transcriptional regulator